jgi:purine-nucleoside phosphorylase
LRVAIVLGSGASPIARSLTGAEPIPFSEFEGFPRPTATGHEGAAYVGDVDGTPTLVLAGRSHLYEGHDAITVVTPMRAAVAAGCKTVILTNAAGAIRSDITPGTLCIISDQLNLTGANPFSGAEFHDLSRLYDPELRALARRIDPSLTEGVYASLRGPTYETPAEIRMLSILGADLVGMSTVLEAMAAHVAGARVMGISIATNQAAGLSSEPLSHTEVVTVMNEAAPKLERLLRGLVREL